MPLCHSQCRGFRSNSFLKLLLNVEILTFFVVVSSGTVFLVQSCIYLLIFGVLFTLYIVTSKANNRGFNIDPSDEEEEGVTTASSEEEEEERAIIDHEEPTAVRGL